MPKAKWLKGFGSRVALLSRYVSPSLLAASLVLIITVFALFVPPYIGMADNGDYFRVLYSNGLYFNNPEYDSLYLGYFNKAFGIFQYYNENGATLTSSQSLLIRLSVWVNQWFDKQVFDIRVQGALLVLLYTVGVYLFVEALTWKVKPKYGYWVAVLAVFLFADTAYTAYFNSFFSESMVWIMLIYLFASGLLLYRKRYPDYMMMIVFFISGLLLTTSKQQNAPVGIIVAVIGIIFIFVRKQRIYRTFVASSLVLLMLTGIATYVLIPKEFVNINKYHAMTRGVLMQSEDPEETLKSFGIDKQYAILNGSIYYEPYTTVDVNSQILENNFYNHYGFASILAYYVSHPDQAGKMMDLAAKNAFTIRPSAMGNYEKSVGKPFGAQSMFFSGYSELKKALAPKTFGFIIIWILVVAGLYTPQFAAAVKAKHVRGMVRLPLILMLMLMGLSGILVSIIGAGDADLSKHEFLFTAAFDLVTFTAVADAICRNLWHDQPAEYESA
ncbi:hypothetical protein [Paenibacillus sp. J22TS3]|uniref:glycan biosynthesis hexose transferase WsfD n=1 Tax=Paenibacillus sp. J22TS3 TaxID=2807192 RepID=UPI001B08A509|nr:hypothetical protein [Paenibacillus sp. J22TS3]GIP22635.1 membrane protein [Paenibacillus sp. J22TS3]